MFRLDRAREKLANQIFTVVLLSVLLVINAGYFYDSVANSKEYTCAALLFLNMLAIVTIFGIVSIRSVIDVTYRESVKLVIDFLISIVAMCVVCVGFISFAFAFSLNYTIDYKIAFVSGVVIIVLFIYYIFIKDHT